MLTQARIKAKADKKQEIELHMNNVLYPPCDSTISSTRSGIPQQSMQAQMLEQEVARCEAQHLRAGWVMVDMTYLCFTAARFSMQHPANLPPSIAAMHCPGMHHSATVKSHRQDAGKTSNSNPAHSQVQTGTGGSSAGEQRPGQQQALDSSNNLEVRQQ